MKILIIKHGALGDVVRTSFALTGLKERFGEHCKIDWLTRSECVPLIQYHPLLEEIWVRKDGRLVSQTDEAWEEGRSYDWVISLDDEAEAVSVLEKSHFKKLTGMYLSQGKPSYTEDARLWFDMGLISKYGKSEADRLKRENRLTHRQMLEKILDIQILRPEFYNDPLVEEEVSKHFACGREKGLRVGLNLGAGSRWPSKQMPEEEIIKLIQVLGGRSAEIYLFSAPEDRVPEGWIKKAAVELTWIQPATLNHFAAWLSHMDRMISSDSLGMHLGIAQKIPVVCYFAPTSADEIDLFGRGIKVVSESDDYCSYQPSADNSTLTVSRVAEAFGRLINGLC